jgi:hypothetical protein
MAIFGEIKIILDAGGGSIKYGVYQERRSTEDDLLLYFTGTSTAKV